MERIQNKVWKNSIDEDSSANNENYFVLRNKADGLADSEIFIIFASQAFEFNLPWIYV